MRKLYIVRCLFLAVLMTICFNTLSAQTFVDGDFMTNTGGTWTNNSSGTATWYKRVAGVWQTTTEFPNGTAGSYTVYVTQNVTFPVTGPNGSFATAKLYITNNAKFTYSYTSSQFTFRNIIIDNGATIEMDGRFTVLSTGEFEILDGGTFIYSYTSNPASSTQLTTTLWNGIEKFHPNSNFIVKNHQTGSGNYFLPPAANLSSNLYNSVTGYFGNLIIASTGGEVRLAANNLSSTTTYLTHGNLEFTTSTSYTVFHGSGTWVIGKNLVLNTGSSGNLTITTGSNIISINVKGDFINNTNNTFRLANASSTSPNVTLNVDGNLLANSGSVDLNFSSGGVGIINLKGDLTVSSSAKLFAGNGSTAIFNFSGTGDGLTPATTQTIDIASTDALRNQYVNFNVITGAYVQLANRDLELGTGSSFKVNALGVFDFGFTATNANNIKIVSGATTTAFTSAQGSILKITSPEGLYQNFDTYIANGVTINTGNLQGIVKSSRSISPVATFWFNGKANQVTGDCLNATVSSSADAKVVICDLATNSNSLTPTVPFGFTSTTTVSPTGGKLDIRVGQFLETTTAYVFYGSGTLYMSSGTLYSISKGSSTAALAYDNMQIIPRFAGGTFKYILNGGTIELAGNTAGNYFQVLRADDANYDYYNVQFAGSNTYNTDYKALSSQTTVTNALTIKGSPVVNCVDVSNSAASFVGNAGISMTGGRLILKNSGPPQPQLTGTATPYFLTGGVIEFSNSNTVGDETIKGVDGNSASIVYNQIEVTGNKVANSNANITLASGGTFTVKNGGIFSINDNAIVGPNGTSETVTIENGGTFKTGDVDGFTGGTGLTATSVRSDIENVILATGSIVEFNRTSGIQTVTGRPDYSNLTLSAASLKTMAGTPSVAGNFVISGGAVTAPSTITFNGASGIQSIAGLDYNNVNLTNGSTKQLTSDASISFSSVITPAAGTLDLNNKIITLKAGTGANYPKTATVSQVGAAISYGPSGAFLIERYIPAKRSFRFMTPEVNTTGTARDNWQEAGSLAGGYGTFITGGAVSNGFDQSITNNPSLFMWDVSTQHYTAVGNTNTGVLNAGNAWRLFVRGDRTIDIYQSDNNPTATPTILRTKGKLLTGTATFNSGISSLPSTLPQLSTIDTGYTFIGNPYASLVDWNNMINVDLVTKKSTFPAVNISPTYHTWDPNFNVRGIYVAYNAITGTAPITSAVSRVLQPGQAIFIQNDGPGSSLQFQEAFKKSTGFSTVFRTSADTTRMAVNLLLNNNGGFQDFADGVLQVFNDSFPTSIGNEDSRKFANQDENLAINENGTLLSIEGRPRVALNDTVLLSIWQYRQTDYFLQFEAQNFATGIDAYLKDSYLQTETRISLTDTTLVPFSLTADSASAASNRFMIVFRPSKSLPVTVTNLKGYEKDKGIQLDWISHSEINIEKYVIEKSLNGHDFNKAGLVKAKGNNSLNETYGWFDSDAQPGPNFYRIGIIDKAGSIQYTPVVKVTIARAAPGISVYPNPAVDNTIGLQVTNMEKGRYAVDLFNGLGQKMFSGFVDHPGGSAYYPVKTGRIMGKGAYRVSIKNGETTINATLIF